VSEPEKDPETLSREDSKEPASPQNQLLALLTLLPVLGVLWLVMTYLPKFGDWMGAKADSVVQTVTGEKSSEEAAPVENEEVTVGDQVDLSEMAVPLDATVPDVANVRTNNEASLLVTAEFETQIIEQLGGPQRAEVRHLAISDDGERIVAALKLKSEDGGGSLIEVFFERDEFGRFLSSEESPVSGRLTLWGE